jgi:adenylosuccinate lyase
LTNKGVSRETAYEWVQRNAMRVWDENLEFEKLVKADTDITSRLTAEEIGRTFSLDHYLRNIDQVFKRLGLI